MKLFDYILAVAAAFAVVFALISYLTDSFVFGLTLSIVLLIGGFFAYKTATPIARNGKSKRYFFKTSLLYGKEYTDRLILTILQSVTEITQADDCLVMNGKTKSVAFNNIKFGNLTEEDAAIGFRTALKLNADRLFFFCREADRKALILLASLDKRVTVINLKSLYRLAKKQGILPVEEKALRAKRDWRFLLRGAVSGVSVRYFLFSSIGLALLSAITPLKTYYLVFSGVNLLFSITALILFGRQGLKKNYFEGA